MSSHYFIGCKCDVQAFEARAGFFDGAGADEGEGGEGLGEDPGEIDLQRGDVFLFREFFWRGRGGRNFRGCTSSERGLCRRESRGRRRTKKPRAWLDQDMQGGFVLACQASQAGSLAVMQSGPDGVDHVGEREIVGEGGKRVLLCFVA